MLGLVMVGCLFIGMNLKLRFLNQIFDLKLIYQRLLLYRWLIMKILW